MGLGLALGLTLGLGLGLDNYFSPSTTTAVIGLDLNHLNQSELRFEHLHTCDLTFEIAA